MVHPASSRTNTSVRYFISLPCRHIGPESSLDVPFSYNMTGNRVDAKDGARNVRQITLAVSAPSSLQRRILFAGRKAVELDDVTARYDKAVDQLCKPGSARGGIVAQLL